MKKSKLPESVLGEFEKFRTAMRDKQVFSKKFSVISKQYHEGLKQHQTHLDNIIDTMEELQMAFLRNRGWTIVRPKRANPYAVAPGSTMDFSIGQATQRQLESEKLDWEYLYGKIPRGGVLGG